MSNRKNYFEHDDRAAKDIRRHMGRRKFNQRGGGGRGTNFHGGRPKYRDYDGDVDMNGASGSGGSARRYNPYKPARNRQRSDKGWMRAKARASLDADPEMNWFKITVPYGKKVGKDFVLKTLLSHCKIPFTPINFQFDGNAASFYVNDYSTARSISDVNKRVTLPDGFKMTVFMNKSSPPTCNAVDEEILRKIELTMNDRYNVMTHALDLRKFHHDLGLRREGYYISLQRPNIFTAVVKIIKERIPEIEKLDISENGLYSLQALSILVPVCTHLTSLSLENNRLKNVRELDHLKGLNITSLVLDGNFLCDDYSDKDTYIIALRQRFPKLMVLDGCELTAPIGFDLGIETVPASKGSFLTAVDDVKCLVIQFLEQYYVIYDSDDREKLLEKYHEQAHFSLSVMKSTYKNNKNTGLNVYFTESRNLLRVVDAGHRARLLRLGRLGVVTALTGLPQTQHDPNSFMVDTSLVLPKVLMFSVTGVFKEVASDMVNQPLRTFHRTFVLFLHGERWVIINDALFIGDATLEQIKAFKCPAPTPSPSPAPSTTDKSPGEKQQLVLEFMKLTGMNMDFAAKCLEENDWEYQKAAVVFQELNSVPGRIPPEAFITDERQQLAIELMKLTGMNIEFSAKCLAENDWNFQKASQVFQELNRLGNIPPEAFIAKMM